MSTVRLRENWVDCIGVLCWQLSHETRSCVNASISRR